MSYDVKHETGNDKFVVEFEGKYSTLDYDVIDGKMLFLSTHVHPDLEGRGIAAALTDAALKYALENKYKIVPLCAYTKSYLLRYKDKYKDNV